MKNKIQEWMIAIGTPWARLWLRFRYWRCGKFKGHTYYLRSIEEGGDLNIVTYDCLHCGTYYFEYPKKGK